jgi:hypothetical protein
MCPASPFSKIKRVVATSRASLNNVVNNNTAGKVENAKGPAKYKDKTTKIHESEIFMAIKISTIKIGKGKIIMNTIATTKNAATISIFFEAEFASSVSLLTKDILKPIDSSMFR